MGFLTTEQVDSLGFASVGRNVLISDKASFYGTSLITIGDNVRIDDFCVISAGEGGIQLGNFIHIAAFASLMGKGRITMGDFSGLSSRVAVYSSSDDYTGFGMTNPTIPSEYTNVKHKNVTIMRHVIVGANSVILPGVVLEEGAAVGALSLVRKSCESFKIYSGNPAVEIGRRSKNLLEKERDFVSKMLSERRE